MNIKSSGLFFAILLYLECPKANLASSRLLNNCFLGTYSIIFLIVRLILANKFALANEVGYMYYL